MEEKWHGNKSSFWLWNAVALISIIVTVVGSIMAINREINYDMMHPSQAAVNPFMNFVILVLSADFFLIAFPLMFLARINVGLWSLFFTLFPAAYLFVSFITEINILLISSVINFSLIFPVFRNHPQQFSKSVSKTG